MKPKQLVLLILVLVALVALAKFSRCRASCRAPASKQATLVPFDLNEVQRFVIAGGSDTVAVSRAGGRWVVESMQNYPANFDQVADNLRRFTEVKGESRGSDASLADQFGFIPTNTDYLLIKFEAAGAKPLGSVELGSPRTGANGYPEGQYARNADGQVILADQFLGAFPRRAEDWVEKTLLEIPQDGLAYVMVHNAGAEPYGLIPDSNGVWELTSVATNERPQREQIDQVAGALAHLQLAAIAPAGATNTGLDAASTYVGRTTNSLVYTIRTGRKEEPQGRGRYASISVTSEGSDTNEAALAATANARFANWTFILPEFACANLARPRTELLQPATNAPAATAPSTTPPAPSTPGS